MLLWDPAEVSMGLGEGQRVHICGRSSFTPACLPALGTTPGTVGWSKDLLWDTCFQREIYHPYTCCSASPWDWGQWPSADLPGRTVMPRLSALSQVFCIMERPVVWGPAHFHFDLSLCFRFAAYQVGAAISFWPALPSASTFSLALPNPNRQG